MKNWKEEVAIDGIDELEKGTIWESTEFKRLGNA